jgi:hypothetical protein
MTIDAFVGLLLTLTKCTVQKTKQIAYYYYYYYFLFAMFFVYSYNVSEDIHPAAQ